jgi:hypothetical protein
MLVYLDRPARIRGEIVHGGRNLRFDIEAKEAGYLWIQQPEGSGEYRKRSGRASDSGGDAKLLIEVLFSAARTLPLQESAYHATTHSRGSHESCHVNPPSWRLCEERAPTAAAARGGRSKPAAPPVLIRPSS